MNSLQNSKQHYVSNRVLTDSHILINSFFRQAYCYFAYIQISILICHNHQRTLSHKRKNTIKICVGYRTYTLFDLGFSAVTHLRRYTKNVMDDVSLTVIPSLTTTIFKTKQKSPVLAITPKIWDTWHSYQLSAYNMRTTVVK